MLVRNKRRSMPAAEIQLDPPQVHDKAEAPCWLTTEHISGLAIYPIPAGGPSLAYSKIELRGTVETKTSDKLMTHMQQTWKSENLDVIIVCSEEWSSPEDTFTRNLVKIPFSFSLRDCEKTSPLVSDLPPSSNSKSDGIRPKDDQYKISYTITATAYSHRDIIAEAKKKVAVLPVLEEIQESGECFAEQFAAKEVSSHWRLRLARPQTPQVHITAQEPKPIVLDPDKSSIQGSTAVPIFVKMSPAPVSSTKQTCPSKCHMKAYLALKNIYTVDGTPAIDPNFDQIVYDGDSSIQTQKLYEQDSTLKILWDQYSPSITLLR